MRGSTQNYVDFTGGLNTRAAPYVLDARQIRGGLNVHTSPTGAIRKRNGFVDIATLDSPANSLAAANTTAKSMIAAVDDTLVKVTTISTTTLKTGLTADTPWEWVQAQFGAGPVGPMYGINGIDTPQLWDGAAGSTSDWVATTGSVPMGTMLKFHGSRIWMAGDPAAPGRLYYSGISGTAPDPLNWDADNFVDIEPEDGDAITAIGPVGPNLGVWKARKFFLVYDLFTAANRKVSDEIGCVAPRSVVDTPQGTFFLSETDGVLATNGSKITRISDNVITSFTSAAVSQPTFSDACAVYSDSSYFISFATGLEVNDRTFEYDLQTDSWWAHDCSSNQWALVDPTGSPVLYSASPSSPVVQSAFVDGIFTDSNEVYANDAYFDTAYFVWGEPAMMKRVRQVRAEGVGIWEAQYATDFHDTFATLDGETWDATDVTGGIFGGTDTFGGAGIFAPPSSGTASYRYYTPGRARSWSFRFTNSDENDFQVYEITASIDPTRD